MKEQVLSMITVAALGACGVADPESIAEATQEAAQTSRFPVDVFYENFNRLNSGSINGQNGWVGDCMVVPGVLPDKNLDCTGAPGLINGRGAQHSFYRPPNRNYHFQFDAWQSGVTEATHGKVFLENPPGNGSTAIIQFAIGCYGVRASFEYHGNTTKQLLSNSTCLNNVHYRVACIWHDGGPEFRCGASVWPADPDESQFVSIPAIGAHGEPEYVGPFDRVRVLGGIGERLGTTTYDKIQVLSD
jgi:hypothetical protein